MKDPVATYHAYSAAWSEKDVITETSEPQILGNRLRVGWVARQGETEIYTGTDFIEFANDGRIARVTMFYDKTP